MTELKIAAKACAKKRWRRATALARIKQTRCGTGIGPRIAIAHGAAAAGNAPPAWRRRQRRPTHSSELVFSLLCVVRNELGLSAQAACPTCIRMFSQTAGRGSG